MEQLLEEFLMMFTPLGCLIYLAGTFLQWKENHEKVYWLFIKQWNPIFILIGCFMSYLPYFNYLENHYSKRVIIIAYGVPLLLLSVVSIVLIFHLVIYIHRRILVFLLRLFGNVKQLLTIRKKWPHKATKIIDKSLQRLSTKSLSDFTNKNMSSIDVYDLHILEKCCSERLIKVIQKLSDNAKLSYIKTNILEINIDNVKDLIRILSLNKINISHIIQLKLQNSQKIKSDIFIFALQLIDVYKLKDFIPFTTKLLQIKGDIADKAGKTLKTLYQHGNLTQKEKEFIEAFEGTVLIESKVERWREHQCSQPGLNSMVFERELVIPATKFSLS